MPLGEPPSQAVPSAGRLADATLLGAAGQSAAMVDPFNSKQWHTHTLAIFAETGAVN